MTSLPSGSTGTISTAPGWTMYSRVPSSPSGSRTVSRRTSRSLPLKTTSPSTRVSTRGCASGRLPALINALPRCGGSLMDPHACCPQKRGPSALRRGVASRNAAACKANSRLGALRRSCREPVLRHEEIGIQPRFERSGLGTPFVTPLHQRRQRHQDRFGATVGLQAEQRSAIVDEIEFDVAATPIRLEFTLARDVRLVLAPREDRLVGRQEMIADAARESEAVLEPAIAQIVVEDPANAAWLVAMAQKEIFIAPALEPGVIIRPEGFERVAASAMEVNRIVLESVVGGQVHSTAKPPDRLRQRSLAFLGQGHEQPHVHMYRRREGVARMQYQRHAHHLEAAPRKLRSRGARRPRQALTLDVREVDPAALEYVPLFEDAGHALAAGRAFPRITAKRLAIDRLEASHDACLQVDEIIAGAGRIHGELCGRFDADRRRLQRFSRGAAPALDCRYPCGIACRQNGSRRPRRTPCAAPAARFRRER